MVEMMPIIVPDIQNAYGGNAPALIGEDLVSPNHLEQRNFSRAEGHRGTKYLSNCIVGVIHLVVLGNIGIDSGNAETARHVHHVVYPCILKCLDRRDIERVCQIDTDGRIHIVVSVAVIGRVIGTFLHRGVLRASIREEGLRVRHDQTGIPAHVEGSGIDDGFERRTRLTRSEGGVDVPGNLWRIIIEVGAAIHCQNFTSLRIHNNNRAIVDIISSIQRVLVREEILKSWIIKMMMHRLLNVGFQVGVDGGADVEASRDKCLDALLWVAAAEGGFRLLDDPVDEVRVFDVVLVGGEGHFGGKRLGLLDDGRRDRPQSLLLHTHAHHLVQHVVLARQGGLPVARADRGIVARWVLWNSGQQRGAGQRQQGIIWVFAVVIAQIVDSGNTVEVFIALWLQVEEIACRGLDANILRAEGSDVEIHFQYLPLRILLCQTDCQRRFWNFTTQRDLVVMRHVFYNLLGDRAAAAFYGTGGSVFSSGAQDALRVDAGVCPEGM